MKKYIYAIEDDYSFTSNGGDIYVEYTFDIKEGFNTYKYKLVRMLNEPTIGEEVRLMRYECKEELVDEFNKIGIDYDSYEVLVSRSCD